MHLSMTDKQIINPLLWKFEGKIRFHNVSILIDRETSISYISPSLLELNKLKKVKHAKYWLVELATGTKRKVKYFIAMIVKST
jgi:hypothetical protein